MVEKLKKETESMKEGQSKDAGELADLYNNSILNLREGQIVKGKIIYKDNKEVIVDIGYKSEGILSIKEFLNPAEIKVGDEIRVKGQTFGSYTFTSHNWTSITTGSQGGVTWVRRYNTGWHSDSLQYALRLTTGEKSGIIF